jgi:hypothetical protein
VGSDRSSFLTPRFYCADSPQTVESLKKEQTAQEVNRQRVVARIEAAGAEWKNIQSWKGETSVQFLQRCTFPRCFVTANDAIYCARFAQLLHELKLKGWFSLVYYDRLLSDVTCTVTSCTGNEARRCVDPIHPPRTPTAVLWRVGGMKLRSADVYFFEQFVHDRYGRFLNETLALIARWHSDSEIFQAECGSDFPGFRQRSAGSATEYVALASLHFLLDNAQRVKPCELIIVGFDWNIGTSLSGMKTFGTSATNGTSN